MLQKKKMFELEVLQELMLDEINCRLRAIFALFLIGGENRKKIFCILDKMENATQKNIDILNQ
ncbi:hypothetical protein KKA13_03185 [Patescibacteria group bacterium]|nr:hypothetical protein [Patescibacteria group bacterium]